MVKSVCVAFAASLFEILVAVPASALVPQANGSLQQQLGKQDQLITEIAAGWRRGATDYRCRSAWRRCEPYHRGARRCGRTARICRRAARICWRLGAARLVWLAGGAIAAGAAIGVVTAATAAPGCRAAPAPGMCWYYTDPSRTQGFWDYCP